MVLKIGVDIKSVVFVISVVEEVLKNKCSARIANTTKVSLRTKLLLIKDKQTNASTNHNLQLGHMRLNSSEFDILICYKSNDLTCCMASCTLHKIILILLLDGLDYDLS